MRNLYPFVLLLLACKPPVNVTPDDGGVKVTGRDRLMRVCDPEGSILDERPAPEPLEVCDLALTGGEEPLDAGASDLVARNLAAQDLAAHDLAVARDFAAAPDLKTPAGVGISDYSSHAPGAVTLPARGGSYIDPVFKTRIIRVTDATDGQRCNHAYGYWPALNLDSTRLLLACDNAARLYSFDPATNATAYLGTLKDGQSIDLQFEGAYWSHSQPNVLYAIGGTKMWRVDVSKSGASGRFTLVRDFAGIVGYPFVIWQLGKSDDDNVFTFSLRPPGGDSSSGIDTIAYKLDTNQAFVFPRPSDFWTDESQVSKDGRYILVASRPPTTPAYEWRVWDWAANTVRILDNNSTERPGGHYDTGRSMINSDRWSTGLQIRDWGSGLESPRNFFRYLKSDAHTMNWSIADHVSARADDESVVVASTYGALSGNWEPFEKEIVLVRTDGSGFLRLAHTRETRSGSDFFAMPRAALEMMGRHVVYTSDLGSSSRLDVMILKLP